MNVKVEHIYPPIPIRKFDYSAIDDDTYDGPGCPIGFGPTSELAIEDLKAQIFERDPWEYEKCRCENNGDYCDYCNERYEKYGREFTRES